MEKLGFDAHIYDGHSQPNRRIKFEITEDHKWHVVIYIDGVHFDTYGLNTEKEIFDLMRKYQTGEE